MSKLGLVALLAAGAILPVTGARHLTLVDSTPREGATAAAPPREILLKFNEALDPARRAIALRGPAGAVAVGPVRTVDSTAFAVGITGSMAPGEYTVSWLAGAPDHATIRGRFSFTIAPRSGPGIE